MHTSSARARPLVARAASASEPAQIQGRMPRRRCTRRTSAISQGDPRAGRGRPRRRAGAREGARFVKPRRCAAPSRGGNFAAIVPTPTAPAAPAPGARTHALMLAVSSLVPALAAAAHVVAVADAAHDDGVIRAVGLGWTGAWRALDAVLASVLVALPLGTRALRAGLASALLVGAACALLYVLARRLLAACAFAPRFGAAVACLATLATGLSAPWQLEGASPGGSVLGALLALAPLALL